MVEFKAHLTSLGTQGSQASYRYLKPTQGLTLLAAKGGTFALHGSGQGPTWMSS